MLSTQFKGTITELQVATYLLSLGIIVSEPLVQDSKYDLIADVNNQLIRLQVKTSRETKPGCITFNCRSTTNNVRECKKRRYSSNEVDYFATYWNGQCYLVPVDHCSTEKSLWIDNTPYTTSSSAQEYLAEKILKTI